MYNLNRKLEEIEVQGKSIKIAIIGAGHMGTGMVSQVVNMKGMIDVYKRQQILSLCGLVYL